MNFGKRQAVTFVAGIFIGTILFVLFSKSHNVDKMRSKVVDYVRYTPLINNYLSSPKEISEPEQVDDTTEDLFDKVKVLCAVLTTPKYHQKRAIHIKNTWGRRCNKLVFMSTKADSKLGSEALNVTESYNTLWGKTKRSMELIYKKYMDEADWFLKADDDTYVILENLRYFLKDYNSSENHYFGCNFAINKDTTYMSGGGGYALSKATVKKFVEEALTDPKKCRQTDTGFEDLEFGKCLKNIGILANEDSRDKFGSYRFHSFTPKTYLYPGNLPDNNWWWHYIAFPQKKGIDCCSRTAITFHYVNPQDLYIFDFLLYHVRPLGPIIPREFIANSTEFISTTSKSLVKTESKTFSLQVLNKSSKNNLFKKSKPKKASDQHQQNKS